MKFQRYSSKTSTFLLPVHFVLLQDIVEENIIKIFKIPLQDKQINSEQIQTLLQLIKYKISITKNLSMPKRQYSLRMEREVQELEYLKVKLNQHLRVVNSTQLSFHSEVPENYCTLPTVQQQKMKIKSDRYSSEKEKYQNNLRTVLYEIRKKMQQTTRGQLKNIKFRSARKPQSLSPINRQTFDFKIKAVNISPEPKHNPNPLSKSFIQRQSPRKIEKKRHSGKYLDQNADKFVFEPWYQKDQLDFYTLDR